jgi:hypothetical protein
MPNQNTCYPLTIGGITCLYKLSPNTTTKFFYRSVYRNHLHKSVFNKPQWIQTEPKRSNIFWTDEYSALWTIVDFIFAQNYNHMSRRKIERKSDKISNVSRCSIYIVPFLHYCFYHLFSSFFASLFVWEHDKPYVCKVHMDRSFMYMWIFY